MGILVCIFVIEIHFQEKMLKTTENRNGVLHDTLFFPKSMGGLTPETLLATPLR